MASSDFSKFCVCGGKREVIHRAPAGHDELVHSQQNQIQVLMRELPVYELFLVLKLLIKRCCTSFRVDFVKHAVHSLTEVNFLM